LARLFFFVPRRSAVILIYEEVQYQRALENYPSRIPTDFRVCEQYDLDPYLVQAIMRCESSNDPGAVSDRARSG
jgi:soluble lytic murein transglycosylase-like protein